MPSSSNWSNKRAPRGSSEPTLAGGGDDAGCGRDRSPHPPLDLARDPQRRLPRPRPGLGVHRLRGGAWAGAAEIVVANRTPSRAEEAAALAPGVAHLGSAENADSVELIVNATPQGMAGDLSLPVQAASLGPGQLVFDLVYHPALTPLVEAARERGAAAANGLGMLIHQAAHAFRLWTGEDPPLEVMSAAALADLARRD